MKKSLLFLTFFLFLIFSVDCRAEYFSVSEKDSASWTQNKASEILDALSNRASGEYEKLDKLLTSSIDIPYIAKFVAGKYWKLMNKEQAQRYQELFNSYILGIYKTFPLPTGFNGINFEVSNIMQKKHHTEVTIPIKIEGITTTSENPNGTIDLVFSIHRTNSAIKIIDLSISGSSLLLTYRNKIYDLMQKDEEEIEWFLEDFETWIPSSDRYYEDM